MAALAGCGGGSDSSSSTAGGATASAGGEISQEEFVERADAICTSGKKKGLLAMSAYAKAHQGSGKSKSALLIEAIHATFLPQVQTQVEEIRALGLPEGEADQAKAFLKAMEEGIETASKAGQGSQFSSSFKHSAELARELGITSCVYGG